MIRTAYFEHPNYVPLVKRAFGMWDEMQDETPVPLIRRTGLLQIGYEDGPVVQGVRKSAKDHGLQVEQLDAEQIHQRFPLIQPNTDHIGLLEADAGFLHVEKCVASMIRAAKKAGAAYRANAKVDRWQANEDGSFSVHIGDEVLLTKRLIMAAGAWTRTIAGQLELPLKIVRKQQQWFQSDRVEGHVETGFPCFFMETEERDWFYGLPAIDKLGMKIAEHTHGQEVDSVDDLDRETNSEDLQRVSAFVDKHFDFGRSRVIYDSVCMYTMTPDEHFIIDRHPEHGQMTLAAGLSGHGFKFAPVLGKQLVDLLDDQDEPDMEFLKLSRFQN
jgi:sarcosine oxidase